MTAVTRLHRAAGPVTLADASRRFPRRDAFEPTTRLAYGRTQFAGSARSGTTEAGAVQQQLETFVVTEYHSGRSLREIAELVDRSQTAVCRVLDKHSVPRRPIGASRLSDVPD
ncbi:MULTISPECIES: helix-turn-helix domain-containing protein [unclassified Modestobacter]|uniref:helix-turn-helix domain-containing protein n=1 Tax=unclassified Modestobacter TaxID=2643866 RepID=UPI0022AAAEF1|nr:MULTISPECIES: hypothetical protein [unclassified Modestobacter]MCZ2826006.1 hypothetical protein [Modestobacter sp. VKM Ac-2981]MCZ2852929.1 hypothetical protein [Modestobacter sp. VKM Ac-2982]